VKIFQDFSIQIIAYTILNSQNFITYVISSSAFGVGKISKYASVLVPTRSRREASRLCTMAFSQGRPHVALRSQGGQYGSLHVNKNPLHDPRVKPAAFSRYSLFGLVVVLLGAAACMGAVVLKSHSAYRNYLEDYSVNDLADARSILHSLNIMAKRRDGSYAPPSSSLLDAYNIDLLVEPDVEMHLELERCSNDFIDCADVSWSASPIDQDIIGEVAFDAKSKGPSVVMTFRMVC